MHFLRLFGLVSVLTTLFPPLVRAGSAPNYPYSMACDPLQFADGQSVHIILPKPHGRSMVINTPDARSFYIAWDSGTNPEDSGPPVAGGTFEKMQMMTLGAATQGYDPERRRLGRIFNTPGDYEIIVGEWLDGDEAPWQGYCRVRYSTKK